MAQAQDLRGNRQECLAKLRGARRINELALRLIRVRDAGSFGRANRVRRRDIKLIRVRIVRHPLQQYRIRGIPMITAQSDGKNVGRQVGIGANVVG